ncbi:hypothetical protein P8605_04130 [Streptomyces sp. T-3]|nr:hypothetical protein [Streptomyces sp. T-3]
MINSLEIRCYEVAAVMEQHRGGSLIDQRQRTPVRPLVGMPSMSGESATAIAAIAVAGISSIGVVVSAVAGARGQRRQVREQAVVEEERLRSDRQRDAYVSYLSSASDFLNCWWELARELGNESPAPVSERCKELRAQAVGLWQGLRRDFQLVRVVAPPEVMKSVNEMESALVDFDQVAEGWYRNTERNDWAFQPWPEKYDTLYKDCAARMAKFGEAAQASFGPAEILVDLGARRRPLLGRGRGGAGPRSRAGMR